MVARPQHTEAVRTALRRAPIVAVRGPRQSGKTTLARQLTAGLDAVCLDLESPSDLARVANPQLYLGALEGLVVIDGVQARPDLFPLLRVLADRSHAPARLLILGSAWPDITRHASESLAGRIEFVEFGGFDLSEVGVQASERLWLRGGFPRSFLAASDEDSVAWRESLVRTFLERDIPQLGISIPAVTLKRFWTMLAHWHGQLWNASELGRALGFSDKTTRSHLDQLTGTYLVRRLPPWHANLAKRQVRAPKVYLRDSGLLHTLLALPDRDALFAHPKVGASWEGFCPEQVPGAVQPSEAYFRATHGAAEIDLVFPWRGRLQGVEVRWREQPRMTRSLHTAITDLDLEHVWLVYPGDERFPLHERVTALPAAQVPTLAQVL